MTYLCYIDESGTPEVPGTTSHFVLAGLAIPIDRWQEADRQVTAILDKYDLAEGELHTAWLVRAYPEQSKIADFDKLSRVARRSAVSRFRAGELLRLRKLKNTKPYHQAKKTYAKTADYIHLSRSERTALVGEVAACLAQWDFAVLFFEAIDKLHFDPVRTKRSVGDQAFEQVVSRFEQFLARKGTPLVHGLLVHDNNETVASKHTALMRRFHQDGTLWAKINLINETPLFVDSKLTRMVQLADLCSYAVRRFVENGEVDLFGAILGRADVVDNVVVGARHYASMDCVCRICAAHTPWGKKKPNRASAV